MVGAKRPRSQSLPDEVPSSMESGSGGDQVFLPQQTQSLTSLSDYHLEKQSPEEEGQELLLEMDLGEAFPPVVYSVPASVTSPRLKRERSSKRQALVRQAKVEDKTNLQREAV